MNYEKYIIFFKICFYRDLLDSSSHGSSGQIGPVGSRPIQIRPLKTRRNPISRAFLGCAQPFKACLRPVRYGRTHLPMGIGAHYMPLGIKMLYRCIKTQK